MLEPTLLWGRTPRVFGGFLHMLSALNRKKSPISPLLRALVSVRVSQINQCAFCVDMNSALILERGGKKDTIQELTIFKESSKFTDLEKIALEYAEAMTSSTDPISEKISQNLKQYFDDDSIIELTALIAFQILSSKFNSALDASAFGFCSFKNHLTGLE